MVSVPAASTSQNELLIMIIVLYPLTWQSSCSCLGMILSVKSLKAFCTFVCPLEISIMQLKLEVLLEREERKGPSMKHTNS